MMVSIGLSLEIADFRRIATHPKAAIVGLVSLYLLVPLLGFVVASNFPLSSTLALGVILVATCPGGMASNALTYYAGGNLALSVSLTAFGSMIYIFTLPLWFGLAQSQFGEVGVELVLPYSQTAQPLVLLVLFPLVLGMAIRARWNAWARRWEKTAKNCAFAGLFIVFVYLGFAQQDTIAEDAQAAVTPVLILNLSCLGMAFLWMLLFRIKRTDGVALSLEHCVRQEGTAIFVAATLIGSAQMALPLMINASLSWVPLSLVLLTIAGKRPLYVRIRSWLGRETPTIS